MEGRPKGDKKMKAEEIQKMTEDFIGDEDVIKVISKKITISPQVYLPKYPIY